MAFDSRISAVEMEKVPDSSGFCEPIVSNVGRQSKQFRHLVIALPPSSDSNHSLKIHATHRKLFL